METIKERFHHQRERRDSIIWVGAMQRVNDPKHNPLLRALQESGRPVSQQDLDDFNPDELPFPTK